MNDDLISRKSIMDKLYAKANEWRGSYTGDAYATAARMVKKEPAVDVVEVEAVAQMLEDSFGDACACNYNGNDEWLPMVCDSGETCDDCDKPLYCWTQFIKHYGERRADDASESAPTAAHE